MTLVRNYVLACLALFCALTIILFYATPMPESHLEIDSSGYERTATHFEQTSELIDPATPTCHPIQTLAYPFFLGMIYKLCGHSYAWVVSIQMFLALLCGVMIFSMTQHLLGLTTALIALFLWATNLGFLIYVQFLMTEMLLVTFLVAFLYFFFAFLREKNRRDLFLAGLFLGCSVVVKPAGLFFVVPLSCLLLIFLSGSFFHRVSVILILIGSFAVPILGYMTRNKITFGHFAIAPMANEIIYRYFSAKVKAKIEHRNYEEVLQQEQWCTENDLLSEDGWKDSKRFLHQALKNHPLVILKLWLVNVLKTWLGLFSTQWKVLFNPEVKGGDCSFFKMSGETFVARTYQYITYGNIVWLSILSFFEACWMFLRYFFVIISLSGFFREKRYFLLSFCVSYLAYFSLVTGHDGCCRYRMMMEPLLIMLIAHGVHTFLKICGMLRKN